MNWRVRHAHRIRSIKKQKELVPYDIATAGAKAARKRLRSGEERDRERGQSEGRSAAGQRTKKKGIGRDRKQPAVLRIVDMWFLFHVLRDPSRNLVLLMNAVGAGAGGSG
jgi:hypothetical protein